MICNRCGSNNEDGAKVCSTCMASLESVSVNNNQESNNIQINNNVDNKIVKQNKQQGFNGKSIFIILILIVCILGLYFGKDYIIDKFSNTLDDGSNNEIIDTSTTSITIPSNTINTTTTTSIRTTTTRTTTAAVTQDGEVYSYGGFKYPIPKGWTFKV